MVDYVLGVILVKAALFNGDQAFAYSLNREEMDKFVSCLGVCEEDVADVLFYMRRYYACVAHARPDQGFRVAVSGEGHNHCVYGSFTDVRSDYADIGMGYAHTAVAALRLLIDGCAEARLCNQ